MKVHAAFWVYIRAHRKSATVREFPDKDDKDPNKASSWLKDKTGRTYRSLWLSLSDVEKDFKAHEDPTFSLIETPTEISEARMDGRPVFEQTISPQGIDKSNTSVADQQEVAKSRCVKILRYKATSQKYTDAMRVLEILKLSKVCRTSTEVQSAIISIGNILDFLINDVEWNLAIGQHASVIASIQDTVMSIESARHFGKINSKEEEENLILENTEHLVSVRKEHRQFVHNSIQDSEFSDQYLDRGHHPSTNRGFSDFGWIQNGINIDKTLDHSIEASKGVLGRTGSSVTGKLNGKRRRARSKPS